ncbi:MAG TPA: iron ABC transporter permease [Nocardioides sp.]|nr:iron ABC transporter permease [Nocardioides sp.]
MATALAQAPEAGSRTTRTRRRGLGLGLVVLLGVLGLVTFLSITQGSRDISLGEVLRAFGDFSTGKVNDTVTLEVRVPRTIIGLLAGAALGLSGALLQGVTRNPLADPGIMGVNAGAAAAVVAAITFLGVDGVSSYLWFAFVGAALATVLVYAVGSLGRDGATPVKLALAGAAIAAGLTSYTTAMIMTNDRTLDELRFWQVGSLAGRYAPVVTAVAPFVIVGCLLALVCGRWLNALALGEDTARSLGVHVGRTRLGLFAVIALLCGAATAACGPIVFVGLAVPHLARLVCGPDYRWILPYSMVIGPILLLVCDVLGRVLAGDGELQVGVMLGIVGAPFFIALVRYGRLAEL